MEIEWKIGRKERGCWSGSEQNLDRCRTQFKLVKDMEEQFEAMAAVIKKYSN